MLTGVVHMPQATRLDAKSPVTLYLQRASLSNHGFLEGQLVVAFLLAK